ncbi:hypothetical protein NUSPORA_01547 [Nucleospora cyclopteri]
MEITTDFRKRMIIELIEALRESPSFCSISFVYIKEAVLSSEQQIFHSSKNKRDYVISISEKLNRIKNAATQRNPSFSPRKQQIGPQENFYGKTMYDGKKSEFDQYGKYSRKLQEEKKASFAQEFFTPMGKHKNSRSYESHAEKHSMPGSASLMRPISGGKINAERVAQHETENRSKFYDTVNIYNDRELNEREVGRKMKAKNKTMSWLSEFDDLLCEKTQEKRDFSDVKNALEMINSGKDISRISFSSTEIGSHRDLSAESSKRNKIEEKGSSSQIIDISSQAIPKNINFKLEIAKEKEEAIKTVPEQLQKYLETNKLTLYEPKNREVWFEKLCKLEYFSKKYEIQIKYKEYAFIREEEMDEILNIKEEDAEKFLIETIKTFREIKADKKNCFIDYNE